MAGDFIPSGVELIAKGLGQFLSDLKTADNAIAKVGSGVSISSTPFIELGNSILDVGAKATQVAAGGLAVLGAALVTVAAKGTEAFIDLEQGMADIHAISGDTAEAVAPLKDLIGELALDPQLKVTTNEAEQAMYALTKQGLEVTEILDGAGKSTIELANATGGPFKQSAEISAQAMRIWGLEASNMGMIADGITGVLTNSKFEFNDYALALAQGGAVTANFGVSLQDFNTVIAGSASAFSSGSDAGTSFKTMMLRLAAPTKEMQAAMQAYGISLFDGSGQMRDMKDIVADLNRALYGTVTVTSTVGGVTNEVADAAKRASEDMPDLTQTIKEQAEKLDILKNEYALTLQYYDPTSTKARNLANQIDSLTYDYNKNIGKLGEYQSVIDEVNSAQETQITSTKQLTEAERAKLAETLGGADSSRLLLELAKMTGEEFDALSGKVNASGQAMNAAAIRMDTTRGALDILQGVIEAVQIQIGEHFTPLVKGAAQAMTQWVSDNSAGIISFFGNIADGIDNVVDGLVKIGGAFSKFGVRGAAVSLLGQLGFDQKSVAKITSVIDTITSEIDRIKTVFQQFGASGVAFSIGGLLGLDSDSMIAIQETINGIIESITSFVEQIKATLSDMGLEELKGALLGVGAVLATGVFAAIIAGLLSLLTPINLIIAGAALLGAAWAGNWGGIQEITYSVIESMKALGDWWIENLPLMQAVALTAGEVITSVITGFQEALEPVTKQLQEQFRLIGESLNELGIDWSDVWNALVTATQIVAASIGAIILGIIGVVAGLATGIASGVSVAITVFQDLAANFAGIINGMAEILRGWVTVVNSILAGDWANAWNGFLMVLEGGLTFWSNITDAAINILKGSTDVMLATVSGFVTGIIDFFQGMYDDLVGNSIIPDMVKAIVKWFTDLPKKLSNVMKNVYDTVVTPFKELGTEIKEEVTPILEDFTEIILPTLAKGIDSVVSAIENFISAMNSAASAVADFIVPDVLKPGSPPPLAYAMWDIASAAGDANKAVRGLADSISLDSFELAGKSIMQRIAAGAALDGGSLQQAIEAQLGFSAKMFKGKGGEALEDEERAQAKQSLFDTYRSLYDDLVSGKAGKQDFLSVFKSGLKGFDATELKQATGIVATHVDEFISKIQSQFSELTLEMKAQALSAASSLSNIASSFAAELTKEMDAFNKFKEGAASLGVELDKLSGKVKEQQVTLSNEQAELELTQKKLADQQQAYIALGAELDELISKHGIEADGVDTLQEKMSDLQLQIDNTTLALDKKSQAIAKLTGEMTENENAMAKSEEALAAYRRELEMKAYQGSQDFFQDSAKKLEGDLAMIELLTDFIKSGQSEFRIIGQAIGTTGMTADIIHTQISAQQELARLQEQQLERERLITEQKEAQEKLNKLQMQQELFEQARQLGVSDIFAGINFGLDASMQDILDATNRLVNAMIAEIDAGFELGSPSHVMYDMFTDVVAGARDALYDGRSVMGKAMSSMLSPMYDMSSLLPGASSVSTTNNNYYMSVNTGASPASVIQQYNVAKSMYAN